MAYGAFSRYLYVFGLLVSHLFKSVRIKIVAQSALIKCIEFKGRFENGRLVVESGLGCDVSVCLRRRRCQLQNRSLSILALIRDSTQDSIK